MFPLNDLKLGNTVLEKVIVIPPKQSSVQHIELSAKVDQELMKRVPSLVASALFSNMELKVKGKIRGKARMLSTSIKVDHQEKINLNKLLN